MNEKRFNLVKCKEHRWGIEDNTLEKEDKLFFICREGQFETNGLVLLLNQLNDDNEQLKKDATTLIYANQDYRHENEQLKSEIEKLSYANEDLLEEKRIWKQMSDEYIKLSYENEQLKVDKQALIDFIRKEFPKSHKHILEGFE